MIFKKLMLTDDQRALQVFKERVAMLKTEKPFTAREEMIAFSSYLHRSVGRTVGSALARGLRGRAEKIADQLAPYIPRKSSILDMGCGSGEVAEILTRKQGVVVTLTDVVDYNKTELPFIQFDGKTLPFADNTFDVVNLATVLHHAVDPITAFKEAVRVCKEGGIITVIESVYFNGMHKAFNRVADWLYNNVFNDPRISVPWNFMTPGAWNLFFREMGTEVFVTKQLGLDQPLVPEWHTLFVLRKF
jgi:SAM-dependent methyltransferase